MTDARAALRATDPTLGRLMDDLGPIDLTSWRSRWSLDPFRSLARAIIGQQIAGGAARAIFGRLDSFVGERDPATAIAEASDAELRAIGLSANKMAALRDLSARTLDGRLPLDRMGEMTDDEARTHLTAVRGIGPWTADLFLLGQLGRPDVLPGGDLGIRRAVMDLYGLPTMPSEREVMAIGERWRPNRSLATAYLYASLATSRDRAAPPRKRADHSRPA